MKPIQFTRADYARARKKRGVNCGPAAFAAITGKTLEEALAFFPSFRKGDGVTIDTMEKALTRAGCKWTARRYLQPSHGLAVVKIDIGLPEDESPGHWIAAARDGSDRYVFDDWSPAADWLPVGVWGTEVFPRLSADCHGATGKCWISYGIEVDSR